MMLSDSNSDQVLIIDDDPSVLFTLSELLKVKGFKVTTIQDPLDALQVLQEKNFSVVLCDQEMPHTTGLELLIKIKQLTPSTSRILISGKTRLSQITAAIEAGLIYRYILKPWMAEELLLTVQNAVERHWLVTRNAELESCLAVSRFKERQTASASKDANPITSGEQVQAGRTGSMPSIEPESNDLAPADAADLAVQGLRNLLYAFHPNLGTTAARAVVLADAVADLLEFSPQQKQNLRRAAALHDIGLVELDRGVVRRWLRGPDKCSEEEQALIRKHPERGEEILRFSPLFKEAGEVIRFHHEHIDGTGFPSGLKGEMIPWFSRLLAVIIFVAGNPLDSAKAISEMKLLSGTRFDPEAVEIISKQVQLVKMPLGETEILLVELRGGMILAEPILNSQGHPLFPKGREMTEPLINRLSTINRATPLNPFVRIFC